MGFISESWENKVECERLTKENNKLKADNERLQREYNILDEIIDVNNAKIGQLEKENKELKFYIDSYSQVYEVTRYKQALHEIHDLVAEYLCNIDEASVAQKIYNISKIALGIKFGDENVEVDSEGNV